MGRVADLRGAGHAAPRSTAPTGIAHTRWATHGGVTEAQRASALLDQRRRRRLGGPQRHHRELRGDAHASCSARATSSSRETDTEVIAHLVHSLRAASGDLFDAVQQAVAELRRRLRDRRDRSRRARTPSSARAAARRCCCVGLRQTARTSSPPTPRRCCRSPSRSSTSRKATSSRSALDGVHDLRRRRPAGRARRCIESQLSADAIELGPYRHYMQKEIFEQPGAIADTLEMVTGAQSIVARAVRRRRRRQCSATSSSVLILACGTSYHAGTGRALLDRRRSPACRAASRSPASTATATRCRSPTRWSSRSRSPARPPTRWPRCSTRKALGHERLADHLQRARDRADARRAELRFLTRAGPEIGVASTKAFTTQLAALFLLTLVLAKQRGRLDAGARGRAAAAPAPPAGGAATACSRCEPRGHDWARSFAPQAPRAVPRPRHALPDRDGRRAEAQGDLLHPRRGLRRPASSSTARWRWSTRTCRWWWSRRTTR